MFDSRPKLGIEELFTSVNYVRQKFGSLGQVGNRGKDDNWAKVCSRKKLGIEADPP